jgi:hypothetical protein
VFYEQLCALLANNLFTRYDNDDNDDNDDDDDDGADGDASKTEAVMKAINDHVNGVANGDKIDTNRNGDAEGVHVRVHASPQPVSLAAIAATLAAMPHSAWSPLSKSRLLSALLYPAGKAWELPQVSVVGISVVVFILFCCCKLLFLLLFVCGFCLRCYTRKHTRRH